MSDIILPQPKERSLYLARQVDQSSINDISKAIIEINESDEIAIKVFAAYDMVYKPKPIKLYIDSYGGHVYQCLGLLGIMEKSKVPIHTIVTGCAMSCGFLISISGHKRFGYSGSTYLYHQVSSIAWGAVKQMEEDMMEAKRLQRIIEKHTLRYTKISLGKLKDIYQRKVDWYIDSKKAISLGVIDEVI